MNSSLTRIFLIVLGWPLILLFLIIIFETYIWIRGEYVIPSLEKPRTNSIQHPSYHLLGVNALRRFTELSESEQISVIENLESNLVSTKQWLEHLQQSDYELLCLGEDHKETTRHFLSKRFFSKFKVDVLLLEATPKELAHITKRLDARKKYVSLHNADISKIIRAARIKNPNIILYGIEETKKQRTYRQNQYRRGSREDSIAKNFLSKFRPGKRHAIILGAFHCMSDRDWLFERVLNLAPQSLAEKMLNIRVIGENQDGQLEAFVFFLDEIGVVRKDFVIRDMSSIHPLIYEWFFLLNQPSLRQFRTVIVFRQ